MPPSTNQPISTFLGALGWVKIVLRGGGGGGVNESDLFRVSRKGLEAIL